MGTRPFLIVLRGNRGNRQLEKFHRNKQNKSLADLRQMTRGGSLSF